MIISFDIFSQFPEITQFTTTRQGGFSTGNYESFNLSPYVDDVREHWHSNLVKLKSELSIKELVFPFQSHGSEILIVDEEFCQKEETLKNEALTGIDALITCSKELCIAVTTADCVPVLLYDPVRQVIAAVHAGWRGTFARITQKTIQSMKENFGCHPEDLYALIGPSISADVYNVGNELYDIFKAEKFPLELIFTKADDMLLLDLWHANHWLLEQSGIPLHQIQIAGMCTFTHNDKFFSARKLGVKSGRMLNGIVIRNM